MDITVKNESCAASQSGYFHQYTSVQHTMFLLTWCLTFNFQKQLCLKGRDLGLILSYSSAHFFPVCGVHDSSNHGSFLGRHFYKFHKEIGWWSLPFHYKAKMMTTEGKSAQHFTLNCLTIMSTTSGYSQCTACRHNCQCEHTYALKLASVNVEERKWRHSASLLATNQPSKCLNS